MGGVRKQYAELLGEPILLHSIRPFLAHSSIVSAVVALPPDDAADPPSWLTGLDERVTVVAGGAERGESVHRGLQAVPDSVDVVLVHDAARPLVTTEVMLRAREAGPASGGGRRARTHAEQVDATRRVVATPDRAYSGRELRAFRVRCCWRRTAGGGGLRVRTTPRWSSDTGDGRHGRGRRTI